MTGYKARLRSVIALGLCSTIAYAQTTKVQGMITSRSGATMIVKSADSTTVTVLLTDKTEVGQSQGILKVRRKEMSMAALIPGLQIQVEGMAGDQGQLVAKSIKFDGSDLERAEAIRAGLQETQAQANRNK